MSANSVAAAAALRTARDACKAARYVDRKDNAAISATTAAINAALTALNASTGDTSGDYAKALLRQGRGLKDVSHVMRRRHFREAAHSLERAALVQDLIP